GIQWANFPYSAILILGAGPSDDQPISPMCKERCRTGAAIYREKKAPFIIVSGGYVHPFGTKYSEAIEMKKFLIDSCNIPETAIIAEPHARHTTTNIRNANRILFRNGFPMDKKVLCTSSKAHITYVNSIFFDRVCDKDLRYHPYKNVKRLGDNTVEYEPVVESLHEDPFDPLDP
ncbi:MAG TPA: YdcF family protein, partial [Chitinophaga sp.]